MLQCCLCYSQFQRNNLFLGRTYSPLFVQQNHRQGKNLADSGFCNLKFNYRQRAQRYILRQ